MCHVTSSCAQGVGDSDDDAYYSEDTDTDEYVNMALPFEFLEHYNRRKTCTQVADCAKIAYQKWCANGAARRIQMYARRWLLRGHLQFLRTPPPSPRNVDTTQPDGNVLIELLACVVTTLQIQRAEHDVAAKPDNVRPVTPFEAKDADVSDALQLKDALQTAVLITRSAAAVAKDAAYTALVAATEADRTQYMRASQCLMTELRALRREHNRVKNKLQEKPPRSTHATRLAAKAVKRRALRSEFERQLPQEFDTFPSRHHPRSKRRQQQSTAKARRPWC